MMAYLEVDNDNDDDDDDDDDRNSNSVAATNVTNCLQYITAVPFISNRKYNASSTFTSSAKSYV
jgi:hypothetical protein